MPIGSPADDNALRARTTLFEALLDGLPISDDVAWRLVDALDTLVQVRLKKRESADV